MRFFIFFAFILTVGFSNAQELELVNSPYDEQNPVLTPDRQTIYFTRSNHPDNIDGAKDPGDIWYAHRLANGSWGSPTHGGAIINSKEWNGVLGFSLDGTIMYLHNHYYKGTPRSQGVSFSKKTGTVWSEPVNINIPFFKNLSSPQTGWISQDEDIILLSIESFATLGAEDIYVVLKDNTGSWRDPVNLGTTINTKFQELNPYYEPQDSILYFATNGRGGAGSIDIFFSKKLDGSWKNWTAPIPLGDTVNTQGREGGFANYPQHNFAIFSSTQNSDGYGDIKIHRYGVEPEVDSTRRTLFVINSRSGEFINAEVIIKDENGNRREVQVNENGLDMSAFAPGAYQMSIVEDGFLPVQQRLMFGDRNTYTIALQPLETGTRMVLENVLFEQSKDILLPESFEQLDQVVTLMKENPGLKIRLEGHTDSRGHAKANQRLSEMRVEAVERYLIGKGINKRRIQGRGLGGEQPLYPNDTEENRRKNRRVEFVIID